MVVSEQIIIEFVAKGIESTKAGMERINQAVGKTNKEIFTARKVMGMNLQQYRRFNELSPKLSTRGGRVANTVRRITHGLRGFRMEMLGVMFFGMGLMRFFTGLLQPALETAGIFKLISTTLQILFLPIALVLLDALMPILEWFWDLPESAKLLIGQLVLMGAALGTILFVVGMFALGIGSLILAFGGLLGIIEKLFPEPIGDVMASFVGLGIVGGTAGAAFKIWDKISPIMEGVWNKIREIPFIEKLLEGLGITVEAGKSPWEALKSTVWGFFKTMLRQLGLSDEEIEEFGETFRNVKRTLTESIDILKGDFVELKNSLVELTDKFLEMAREVDLTQLVKDVAAIVSEVADLVRWIKDAKVAWDSFARSPIGQVVIAAAALPGAMRAIASEPFRRIGERYTRFQAGGLVTSPTLALLGEAGPEMVTPLGEGVGATTISPTYNITASISSDMDIRRLAERLNDLLTADYRRLTYR